MQVIGYVRVSTDEQTNSGAGLAAQRLAILAWTDFDYGHLFFHSCLSDCW